MQKYTNFVAYTGKFAGLSRRVEFYGTMEGGDGKPGSPEEGSLLGKRTISFSLSLGTCMTHY